MKCEEAKIAAFDQRICIKLRRSCLGDWLNCRHGDVVDIGKLLEVHKYYSEDVDVKMERPAEESALENTVVADLKERLLPPKPASATNHRETSYRPSASGRQPFQGVKGLRSWIRVDAATGDSQIIEVDKFTIMRRCDLPARDLRLLDPLFVYLSTILGREKFIVVNLEQIRCIITADEVLLLNSLDSYVLQYVVGCNGN
ncbi:putative magnesium transporter MRS2 [Helianthus anomalus]